MKQITPAQHFAATATPFVYEGREYHEGKLVTKTFETPRFAKLGESQPAAIKRYMAALKRKTRSPEPRNFPSTAVAKSTKEYVEQFYAMNFSQKPPYSNLSTSPTTWPEGPEVEFSEEP